MSRMNDGWHKIAGFDVYVEDGYILRGVLRKSELSEVPAYVYRFDSAAGHGWWKENKISVAAFRAGVKRGTVSLK